jgi:threonine/homoserine/homoserine lactone efflux protein
MTWYRVKYAGVAYLPYLAFRLWTAPARPIDAAAEVGRERAHRLFSRPETVKWIQRGTGVAMASGAVAVATR